MFTSSFRNYILFTKLYKVVGSRSII